MIAQAVLWGIPTPAFSTALAFFDGYRSDIVPANLLQAQVRSENFESEQELIVYYSGTTLVPTPSVFCLAKRTRSSRRVKIFVRILQYL